MGTKQTRSKMHKKKKIQRSKTKTGMSSNSSPLKKEHEDDVHEALLCVLRTKKIPKEQLLNMAKYGGIEVDVVSTLDKVRGVDINDDDDHDTQKKHKKMDFYDPSILASPTEELSGNDMMENNDLIFQEVIDLARGGMGGHFTNTLNKKREKNKNRKKKKKKKIKIIKKKKKKKRKRMPSISSLDSLPVSPNKYNKFDLLCPQTKKRKITKTKNHSIQTPIAPKTRRQIISTPQHKTNDIQITANSMNPTPKTTKSTTTTTTTQKPTIKPTKQRRKKKVVKSYSSLNQLVIEQTNLGNNIKEKPKREKIKHKKRNNKSRRGATSSSLMGLFS